jgi:hypothetical protein
MPEIPDVVPGEPVESDWGNTVRDRVIQRYADRTALEASVPVPEPGAVAWLENVAAMVAWDGAAWVPLGNVSQPLTTFQQVERASSGMQQWRREGHGWATWQIASGGGVLLDMTDLLGANSIRPMEWLYPSGRVNMPFGINDGVVARGANAARVQLIRETIALSHRWAIASDGSLLMQTSPWPGDTWTTTWAYFTTYAENSVPIRMAGNTGTRLHYKNNSGGTLTPDFDAVWDSSGASPFPTDQQLYRGSAFAIRATADAAVLASSEVVTVEPMATRAATPSVDDLAAKVVTTTEGKSGAVVEVPDDWELGGTLRGVVAVLVDEVQSLRARVAALEGA